MLVIHLGNDTHSLTPELGRESTRMATRRALESLTMRVETEPAAASYICRGQDFFFPHTISCPGEKKRFYQELLFTHPFKEGPLEDSSAFGFYEAASDYLRSSAIYVFSTPKNALTSAADQKAISDFMSRVIGHLALEPKISPEELGLLNDVARALRLTACQKFELDGIARRHSARNKNGLLPLKDFLGRTPQSKDEVKRLFTEVCDALT